MGNRAYSGPERRRERPVTHDDLEELRSNIDERINQTQKDVSDLKAAFNQCHVKITDELGKSKDGYRNLDQKMDLVIELLRPNSEAKKPAPNQKMWGVALGKLAWFGAISSGVALFLIGAYLLGFLPEALELIRGSK